MSLVDRMIAAGLRALPAEDAAAHCDVPCGIYDPHTAQLAAHTIIRMVDLIEGLGELNSTEKLHTFSRHVAVKEEHAKIAEHEIIVLWSDYFRPEHLEKAPNLHDIVWKTAKLTSTVKQQINKQAALDLLAGTQQIAEIFWASKGVATKRVPSGQPSGGEIVQPVLG
ncbi:MAG: superoxide dismutase, Ni [Chloroflexi bacterium]|nr:superoxide dismutase, Ni [Chloroflexota bacterium]